MGGAPTALRRRRPRRNTGPLLADPPEGGTPESEEEEVLRAQEARGVRVSGPEEGGCSLNTCVLLVLLIAVSISVGHYYGKYLQGGWKCKKNCLACRK